MKIAIIIVLYKTPPKEKDRLEKEVMSLDLKNYNLYFIDNTFNNKGYAFAINKGIKKAIKNKPDLFIIANPDISFNNLKANSLLEGSEHFDIWGLAMKMQNKVFYGGVINPIHLSGGLNQIKPIKRFNTVSWISGSLMFIKNNVINKTGLFDESYFMYYEDVDYCIRARKSGFKIGIDIANIYNHYEKSRFNPIKKYLLFNAQQKFLVKHGNIGQKIYDFFFRMSKSKFFINFLSLNISSLINKFFNFILFIFLVRYLNPNNYGIYTLVWVFVGLLAPFLDFGTTSYGLIYLKDKQDNKFNSLISLRWYLSLCIFAVTVILAILSGYSKEIVILILLTSFTLFSNMWSGTYLIINSLKQQIIKSSIVSVCFNLMLTAAVIISLIMTKNLLNIFLIISIGYIFYTLFNWYLVKKEIINLSLKIKFKLWLEIIKKSYIFVLISFFSGLYFKQDVFLLNYFKSENTVGIYSAGYKFFEALIFIAASYNISSIPTFSKLANDKPRLIKRIKRDLILLLGIGLIISISVLIFSPYLLPYVLKNYYTQSIIVTQVVIFGLPFILLSSVFLNTLYVLGKSKIVALIFLFQLALNLILNVIFIPKYSYMSSATITVLSEIVNLTLSFMCVKYILSKK